MADFCPEVAAVLSIASAAAKVIPTAIGLGDSFLDALTLDRQDEATVNARLAKMKARRLETDGIDAESSIAFAPANHTISDLTEALSKRFPHIAASVKLMSHSRRSILVKAGVTISSQFGTAQNDNSLRGFLSLAKRFQKDSNGDKLSFDILTASEDDDEEVEQILADSLYQIINKECPRAHSGWPYLVASRSREEISAEDCGNIIARTAPGTKSVRTESQGYRFPYIIVTGKTGAGKSALCRIIVGENGVFRTVKGSTGTTQLRAKQISISNYKLALVDTPGLGDRHGGDALSVINMTQQLVGQGRTAVHIHVVKHDEDRPGVVDEDVLGNYADILGKALVTRLVVVVTHKNSDNVDLTLESWQEHVIASSTGELGRALQVVKLDLTQMDWEKGEHPERYAILSGVEKCLRLRTIQNQRITDMEVWRSKIRDGANLAEADKARLVFKKRYDAVFHQAMQRLWKMGHPQVWYSGTACMLRSKTGSRLTGSRCVETVVLLFQTPEKAFYAKKPLQRADSYLTAIGVVPKNTVPVCYDQELSQTGVLYESNTTYFRIVNLEDLFEVVVEQSRDDAQKYARMLGGLSKATLLAAQCK